MDAVNISTKSKFVVLTCTKICVFFYSFHSYGMYNKARRSMWIFPNISQHLFAIKTEFHVIVFVPSAVKVAGITAAQSTDNLTTEVL